MEEEKRKEEKRREICEERGELCGEMLLYTTISTWKRKKKTAKVRGQINTLRPIRAGESDVAAKGQEEELRAAVRPGCIPPGDKEGQQHEQEQKRWPRYPNSSSVCLITQR
ncbi:hypothetical protein KOW79_021112 [Hemibagrus wyckioides]|uniref:Uncharacterized protein n=1 Tax=Hemibagrus wyckioides TaxID=337641 RepID=A0A9D3N2X6_9TELE|nr:hypothetical protein KOW79_021112 [Hemibagrus wyckioides]